jgi:hypothetical protein
MRIGIALLVIVDLCIRVSDLKAHYTNDGLWPNNLIYNFGWNSGYWSLHALSGSIAFEIILFTVHFLVAFFLLLGYKTGLSSVLVWLLTISLHNRNLFILQSGDDLLRLVLLWGIFLPWQAHYSLDAQRNPIKRKQNTLANFGYLFLIASVYFFSANLKSSPEWHNEGSAVYYALSLEQLRLPLGDLLYMHPTLLKIITWFTLYSEYFIAFLILIPSKKGLFRFVAFVLIILLHSGIGLTLYVGLFFLISIVAAMGFIPASAIDTFEKRFKIRRTVFTIQKRENSFTRTLNVSICAILIFLCLMINLSTVKWFPSELRNEFSYVSNIVRLNQYWGMFSPGVLKKDGWFVYYGRDSIGRQWDLRRNENYVDFSKPERIVSMYKNDRWRKLAENMQNDKYTFLRPLYCAYRLDTWNKKHSNKKMNSLSVYFMEKENLPNYKTTSPIKVLHCGCYAH